MPCMQSRWVLRKAQISRARHCFRRKFSNYWNSQRGQQITRDTTSCLKYHHPWKLSRIMIYLFFMILRILSCWRRVLDMKALFFSARGHNMFPKICQIPSSIIFWKIFFMKTNQWIKGSWCIVGWWRSTNQLVLIINWFGIITLKIRWCNTTWSLMKIVKANQDFGITLSFKPSLLNIASFMVLLIENQGRVLWKRERLM